MLERRLRSLCILRPAVLAAVCVTCATGGTIISVSGDTSEFDLVRTNALFASSWSQTGSYTGVNIAAELNSFDGGPVTGTAYLTKSLGPGTTIANQIASAPYAVTSTTPTLLTLFSGLNLGPGSYFLLLTGPGVLASNEVGWATDASATSIPPVVITDSGVTLGSVYFASSSAAYAPASMFSVVDPTFGDLEFQVTAKLQVSTPEPRSLELILLGGLVIGMPLIRRRSGRGIADLFLPSRHRQL